MVPTPFVFLGFAALSIAAGTVNTARGALTGGICSNSRAEYFTSIPYAEPPVGERRFKAPQSFNGRYRGDAIAKPPACIQFGTTFIENGVQSEDCLYINVWRPRNTGKDSRLPVKVWFYGGANTAGGISDPMYNGCELAASDSIVVSANYRLGPFGWLSLLSANLTGNYGLQDQLLALEWVQDNIADFGGDSAKVVLFGQSAGAIDIFPITTMDQAPRLMNGAVMQSGGSNDFPTLLEVEASSRSYIKSLGCDIDDISCLHEKTPAEFNRTFIASLEAAPALPAGSLFSNQGRGFSSGPVIDGIVLRVQPSRVGAKVPSVFGSNAQDGTLFVLGKFGTPQLNESHWDEFLKYNFHELAGVVNQTISLSNFQATPFPVFYAMSTVITDMTYRCTAYRGAMASFANKVPAWTYSFNHTPSCNWLTSLPQEQSILKLLGPTHTAELPFVWGLLQDQPTGSGDCNLSPAEASLSGWMVDAWTSMAKFGHPGPEWPTFHPNTSFGININNTPEAGVIDYSICSKFWDKLEKEILFLDAKRHSGS